MLWKSFGVTIKMANKSRDQSTILTAHRAHPLPLVPIASLTPLSLWLSRAKNMNAARRWQCIKTSMWVYLENVTPCCRVLRPPLTFCSTSLWPSWAHWARSSLSPGAHWLGALNCFTFDDKLAEDTARACQMANGRRV